MEASREGPCRGGGGKSKAALGGTAGATAEGEEPHGGDTAGTARYVHMLCVGVWMGWVGMEALSFCEFLYICSYVIVPVACTCPAPRN